MKSNISTFALLFSAVVAAGVLDAQDASAAITVNGQKAASTLTNVPPDRDLSVTTNAITYAGSADQAMKDRLAAEFPNWTFIYMNNGLNGTLNINTYAPVVLADDWGGAKIDATYTTGNNDPAVADLRWIQLVTTNRPLGGNTSPYIDPRPNDDKLPFYWTNAEDVANANVAGNCGNFTQGAKTATTYHYYDCSNRNPPSGAADTSWSGELVLASWADPGGNNWGNQSPPDGKRTVYVYDGINWGWTLHDPVDPVPEPATWSLLLVGFFGLGAALRKSSRAAAAA